MTLPSDVQRAPSDRAAVEQMAMFLPEPDPEIVAALNARPRPRKEVWRGGQWVVWDEQTPLPEIARSKGGMRIACQYVWVVELKAFAAIRFRFTGEEWADEESAAFENITTAMNKAHDRFPLGEVVWPAGWCAHPETGHGIRIEEAGQHDGFWITPERPITREVAA